MIELFRSGNTGFLPISPYFQSDNNSKQNLKNSALGAGSRRFKSCRPDYYKVNKQKELGLTFGRSEVLQKCRNNGYYPLFFHNYSIRSNTIDRKSVV